jgi:RNA polymerase sigma-70 factor (TIGR02960 family)
VTQDKLARARAGDGQAFAELVDPYRQELQVHCYRMLGSVQDAEDALQETLVSAWRGLAEFAERASLRTWLYRIATSRCLNSLRSASRRPKEVGPLPEFDLPEPAGRSEVVWLEPYPDVLLQGAAGTPGPEAKYEASEAISLAFITTMQLLPPRQRAALILRDVLGFSGPEVAAMLESTDQSANSALKRARATLRRELSSPDQQPPPAPNSATEKRLVDRFTRAFSTGDVAGLVALLTEDVRLNMPPLPLQYQGRTVAERFHTVVTFRDGRTYRLIPTRANGQPAFGLYIRDTHARLLHANGLMVLSLSGARISAMTRFDNSVLSHFGLPRTLPDEMRRQ